MCWACLTCWPCSGECICAGAVKAQTAAASAICTPRSAQQCGGQLSSVVVCMQGKRGFRSGRHNTSSSSPMRDATGLGLTSGTAHKILEALLLHLYLWFWLLLSPEQPPLTCVDPWSFHRDTMLIPSASSEANFRYWKMQRESAWCLYKALFRERGVQLTAATAASTAKAHAHRPALRVCRMFTVMTPWWRQGRSLQRVEVHLTVLCEDVCQHWNALTSQALVSVDDRQRCILPAD